MKSTDPRVTTSQETLVGILAIAVLLLATRPHVGLYHDAVLYAAQAVSDASHGALQNDLFFKYGNQDGFSVFSQIYRPLAALVGLRLANTVLWALGTLVWAVAVVALSFSVFDNRKQALLAIGAVLVLFPGYGDQTLSYGENFVTPRPWSEAAGMLAVACQMRHRISRSFIMLSASVVLHPLTSLPFAALVLWLWLTNPFRFGLICLATLVGVLCLGLAGLSPFDWVFDRLDDAWLQVVDRYSSLVFINSWITTPAAAWIALPVFSLVLSLRHSSGPVRNLQKGVLVLAGGFSLLSFLVSDLTLNRLFLSLQFWRAEILLAVFGNLFAFHALSCLKQSERGRVFFSMAMITSALGHIFGIGPLPSSVFVAAALVNYCWPSRAAKLVAIVLASLAIAILMGLFAIEARKIEAVVVFDRVLASALVVTAGAVLLFPAGRKRSAFFGSAGALVLCTGVAAASYDKRSDWQKYVMQPSADKDRLAALIKGQTVYWENGLLLMWFGLANPQFYSCRQKAGIVFFREQALEFERRAEVLGQLNTLDFALVKDHVCPTMAGTEPYQDLTPGLLQTVCRQVPELDLVALRRDVPGLPRTVWSLPVAATAWLHPNLEGNSDRQRTHYVFHCESLRRKL